MIDLVIPNKNEKELAIRAKELGIKEMVFLKQFKSADEAKQYAELAKDLEAELKMSLKVGRLARVRARSDCRRFNFDSIFCMVVAASEGSEEANRIIFESQVDAIIDVSSSTGRDHTHYRNSGMNQVLAKLASKKGMTYCLDFSRLLNLNQRQRVLLLGRWMQNIRILRKYSVKVEIYSFATKPEELRCINDLEALKRIL